MPSKSFRTHYSWAVFSYVSVLLEAPACPYAAYGERLNKISRNFISDNFTKTGRKYPNLDKTGQKQRRFHVITCMDEWTHVQLSIMTR
jgi:hypothetical protein